MCAIIIIRMTLITDYTSPGSVIWISVKGDQIGRESWSVYSKYTQAFGKTEKKSARRVLPDIWTVEAERNYSSRGNEEDGFVEQHVLPDGTEVWEWIKRCVSFGIYVKIRKRDFETDLPDGWQVCQKVEVLKWFTAVWVINRIFFQMKIILDIF